MDVPDPPTEGMCACVCLERRHSTPGSHWELREASILLEGGCILGQSSYTAQEASGWTGREKLGGKVKIWSGFGCNCRAGRAALTEIQRKYKNNIHKNSKNIHFRLIVDYY